jgi:hypothetical protein
MKITDSLSPKLAKPMSKKILNTDLLETKATCDSCAMAKGKHRGKVHYNPHLKCCTFYPFIPNFLVGEILSTGGRGSEIVLDLIQRRQYALPLGLVAPISYQVPFNQRQETDFGNREDWICPYYNRESENCNIWQSRSSVCISFICKSSYKAKGLKFWKNLGDYLHGIEMTLMEECLVQMDFSPRQVSDLVDYLNRYEGTKEELASKTLSAKLHKELWNGYEDDIPGFYKKCYQFIGHSSKGELRESMGMFVEELEQKVEESIDELNL